MEAVWGAVGAAAGVLACCGLPLLAALAMAALGRRQGEEQSQGKDGGHACCPPPLGAAREGRRGGSRERGH